MFLLLLQPIEERQFESALFKNLCETLGSGRIRTTAYHPIANGMVERFHRQLKAALKSHKMPENWTQTLLMVLLGMRSTIKVDLNCTSAELVYGTTIRLPRGFFSTKDCALPDPTDYVQRLKSAMSMLRAVPPRTSSRIVSVSPDLYTQSHVFIRRDSVRKPLQPPYDGAFRVLNRTKKFSL